MILSCHFQNVIAAHTYTNKPWLIIEFQADSDTGSLKLEIIKEKRNAGNYLLVKLYIIQFDRFSSSCLTLSFKKNSII